MNFNKAVILGNVTRDPESRAMPSGQQVVSFSIATNRFYTDQAGQKKQEAEFHNVVVFGKLADIASKYLNKGALVMIEGRIKTRNWTNQSGVKQYRTEIIAETMQLGPRSQGTGQGGQTQYSKPSYPAPTNNMPKPMGQSQSNAEEIPIIEENAPPTNFVSQEGPTKREDGVIDVKDIPF